MLEKTVFQEKITTLLPEIELRLNEPMAKHTSFRIGGPVEVMAFPKSREELAQLLKTSALLDVKPAILGAGTNILAPDAGMAGLVICLKEGLGGMEQTGENTIEIGAGISMSKAAVFAASLGLSGLEFAHGIPGSVGGGIYMNAGAYGGELCQAAVSTVALLPDGTVWEAEGEQQGFSYRSSAFQEKGAVVLRSRFRLQPGDRQQITARMQELAAKRKASQPLEQPSAGSTFKRPVGGYAAALIDSAGLKGKGVGRAAVSEKHAGFVVNLGGATAADVLDTMAMVQKEVLEKSGIRLEPEVRIW